MSEHTLSKRPFTDLLQDLSPYIYGTTRLGDDTLSREDRVAIAHKAMATGVWLHVSEQYGSALEVLAEAYDSASYAKPRTLFKMEAESIDELRDLTLRHTQPLKVERMDIGQLGLRDRKPEELCPGSDGYKKLLALKEEGLVGRYVMEVFPWTAPVALQALKGGCMDELVDGLIFYLNPLQRFVSNEVWELVREHNIPVIAMRTVCGASVHDLRDVPGAAWQPYLQERAVEVAPIFEESGEDDWGRFCLRFAFSIPQVRATTGSTARESHLYAFLENVKNIEPLPARTMQQLQELHSRWAEVTDAHAKPWSM